MARSDEELRALIEQSAMLNELANHPGWPVLVDWLETLMRPLKIEILNGGVNDHETYLKRAWFCVGATAAIDAPKKVAEMLATEQATRRQ